MNTPADEFSEPRDTLQQPAPPLSATLRPSSDETSLTAPRHRLGQSSEAEHLVPVGLADLAKGMALANEALPSVAPSAVLMESLVAPPAEGSAEAPAIESLAVERAPVVLPHLAAEESWHRRASGRPVPGAAAASGSARAASAATALGLGAAAPASAVVPTSPEPAPAPVPMMVADLVEAPGGGSSRVGTTTKHAPLASVTPTLVPEQSIPPERAGWLVVQSGTQHRPGHVLQMLFQSQQFYRLGAGMDCDIVLQGPGIAAAHAEIRFERQRGTVQLTDLGSPGGTFFQPPGMGTYQVQGTVMLTDGSQVWLGRERVCLTFRCS